jgi:hypothetical protein
MEGVRVACCDRIHATIAATSRRVGCSEIANGVATLVGVSLASRRERDPDHFCQNCFARSLGEQRRSQLAAMAAAPAIGSAMIEDCYLS